MKIVRYDYRNPRIPAAVQQSYMVFTLSGDEVAGPYATLDAAQRAYPKARWNFEVCCSSNPSRRNRTMTLSKGWINRQITRVERESKTWPDWMRRETELRVQEQKASTSTLKPATEKEAGSPAVKKAGGASNAAGEGGERQKQ
jgi:hypothetical protein